MKKYFFSLIILLSFSTFTIAQNVGIGTTNPDEKLTVVGTIKSNINSNSNFPQIHIHESQNDFGRLKYTNTSSSQYFMLSANPQMDSTLARFHINNSDFGNIGSFTGHGRFGINATNPAATLHLSSQPGTDLLRIQNTIFTKFRIFSNNAMVFGANWLAPIPNVIRMETPSLFIGFNGNHIPESRLEVDGTISSILDSDVNTPHLHLFEDNYDYSRIKFSNRSTSNYFSLEARPAKDSTQARFKLYNSASGEDIFTATGNGRLGVNVVPAATIHSNAISGADPIRIQNNNFTKFRMFSNNAMVLGSNWETPIPDVIRIVTPNLVVGFGESHLPKEKLEIDGGIKIGAASGTPSDGAIQYVANSKEFQVYTNNQWNTVAFDNDPLEIGDNAYGGIVFWLDESGEHGLVASANDFSSTYEWGTENAFYYDADGKGIYAGKRNTLIIIENTSGSSITCAAKVCQQYQGGGYGDWYLPSTSEFSIMRTASNSLSNLNLVNDYYWTSNEEIDQTDVKAEAYWGGGSFNDFLQIKTTRNKVRAIRAF